MRACFACAKCLGVGLKEYGGWALLWGRYPSLQRVGWCLYGRMGFGRQSMSKARR